jgi:hypothetical protein
LRRASLLFLAAAAALALVTGSSARLGPPSFVVGATEDYALWQDDGGALVYDQLQLSGLGAIRMSVNYDPAQPTTIQNGDALERAIGPAVERGIRVLLSIAPEHNNDVTGSRDGVKRFADYTALVARAFPEVTDFIIGNEPNLGRFWSPTFAPDGSIGAAATYEAALAASYDALKAVSPEIDVIGLAVSPRGDDRPGSARKTVSPVRFIAAVGAAYRASGRTLPIMDNVALHPYPNRNTDPPDRGYSWPNAGVPNLDRVQQAFWDAFNGTGQPTFEENGAARRPAAAPRPPVRWILDEAGWQTKTQNLPGYDGTENVPAVDEATQAAYHAAVVRRFACDPHVAALLFFHWVDETDRDRFQSGAIRADASEKPAVESVRQAVDAGCQGAPTGWRHSNTVDGASLDTVPRKGFLFFVEADEDATFVATATAKRRGVEPRQVVAAGDVKAYRPAGVKLPGIRVVNLGRYTVTVQVGAALNTARTARLSRRGRSAH